MAWQEDIDNKYQPMVDTLTTNTTMMTDYQTWLNGLSGSCTASELISAIDASTFVRDTMGLDSSGISESASAENVQTWITNERTWCESMLTKFNTSKSGLEATITEIQSKIAAEEPYPA